MHKLSEIRQSLGWSQAAMARYLGVDQSTVSRIETGNHEVSGPIQRLIEFLARDQRKAKARKGAA